MSQADSDNTRTPSRRDVINGDEAIDLVKMRGTLQQYHTLWDVREALSDMGSLISDGRRRDRKKLTKAWKRGMDALGRHIREWEALESLKHTPWGNEEAEQRQTAADQRIVSWGYQAFAAEEKANRPGTKQKELDQACELYDHRARLIADTPARHPGAILIKLKIAADNISEMERDTSDTMNLLSAIADCERLAKAGLSHEQRKAAE